MKSGLAIAVLILALGGCVGRGPEAPPAAADAPVIRLEYWTPFSGGDNRFMTEMISRFNKEHDNIRIVQTNSRLDDYYSRLRTAILAGNAPDVAVIHTTSLPQFVQNGYIENLEKPATDIGLDWTAFNPNILKSTVFDGQPYAVPLDTHALVMYYNKTLLRQAGLLGPDDKPVIGAGAKGYIEFLEKIRSAIPADTAPMAQPSTRIDSVWLWWSLYNQMKGGGSFYNEDASRTVIDNAKALEALKYVNGLYRSKLIPPDINDAFKLFYDGKAAVLITGMWGTGAFENAEGLDFGVVPVPVFYDRPAVWGDSHTLTIPANRSMSSEQRKAVMTFAKWMVDNSELWAKAGHVPSMTKAVLSDEFRKLKFRSDYAATANYVAYWPRHVKQWSIVEILIKEFERMNYGQQTPEQTLRKAARLIDAELTS